MAEITDEDLGHLEDAANRIRMRQSAARAAERRSRIARRNLLVAGAKSLAVVAAVGTPVGAIAGVTINQFRESAKEHVSRIKDALMLHAHEEVYVLREKIILENINLRDAPFGPGTPNGDHTVVTPLGKRKITLESPLVIRNKHREGLVRVGTEMNDLWVVYWDREKQELKYVSVAVINNFKGGSIDINSLIPGKLNFENEWGVQLTTLENEIIPVGLEPK